MGSLLVVAACGGTPSVETPALARSKPVPERHVDCFDDLPANAVKVATFNIHAGRDAHISQIGAATRSLDVDVIGLQEIDVNTRRTSVDQPAVLRETTGMTVHFVKTLDYQGGDYGLGVASRVASQATSAPLTAVTEPRKVVLSNHTFDGHELTVATAHLDPPAEDDVQFDSFVAVLTEHAPDIVLVDLNASPDTDRYASILELGYRDAWDLQAENPGATFAKDGIETRIDFVFVGPDFQPRCSEVIDTKLSDHRVVRAAIIPR